MVLFFLGIQDLLLGLNIPFVLFLLMDPLGQLVLLDHIFLHMSLLKFLDMDLRNCDNMVLNCQCMNLQHRDYHNSHPLDSLLHDDLLLKVL